MSRKRSPNWHLAERRQRMFHLCWLPRRSRYRSILFALQPQYPFNLSVHENGSNPIINYGCVTVCFIHLTLYLTLNHDYFQCHVRVTSLLMCQMQLHPHHPTIATVRSPTPVIPGYSMVGNNMIFCVQGSQFNGDLPQCQAVQGRFSVHISYQILNWDLISSQQNNKLEWAFKLVKHFNLSNLFCSFSVGGNLICGDDDRCNSLYAQLGRAVPWEYDDGRKGLLSRS